ncbi:hypothetical protein ARMGADRAFT_1033184 [Armillaria gallica]|uniref:Uncharacterized protein n=1 Tax=Armillaria gallica TaxID=47427 RepID=A0A2H3DQC5_ARMGA|nr:hypothetical protein ARMGADRAFT_1033184 [Armillaria gallica]
MTTTTTTVTKERSSSIPRCYLVGQADFVQKGKDLLYSNGRSQHAFEYFGFHASDPDPPPSLRHSTGQPALKTVCAIKPNDDFPPSQSGSLSTSTGPQGLCAVLILTTVVDRSVLGKLAEARVSFLKRRRPTVERPPVPVNPAIPVAHCKPRCSSPFRFLTGAVFSRWQGDKARYGLSGSWTVFLKGLETDMSAHAERRECAGSAEHHYARGARKEMDLRGSRPVSRLGQDRHPTTNGLRRRLQDLTLPIRLLVCRSRLPVKETTWYSGVSTRNIAHLERGHTFTAVDTEEREECARRGQCGGLACACGGRHARGGWREGRVVDGPRMVCGRRWVCAERTVQADEYGLRPVKTASFPLLKCSQCTRRVYMMQKTTTTTSLDVPTITFDSLAMLDIKPGHSTYDPSTRGLWSDSRRVGEARVMRGGRWVESRRAGGGEDGVEGGTCACLRRAACGEGHRRVRVIIRVGGGRSDWKEGQWEGGSCGCEGRSEGRLVGWPFFIETGEGFGGRLWGQAISRKVASECGRGLDEGENESDKGRTEEGDLEVTWQSRRQRAVVVIAVDSYTLRTSDRHLRHLRARPTGITMSATTLELFPAPSPSPSKHTPTILPGADADSIVALQNVLRENHARWHIFFNDKRFHNHTTHHALAIWALGANKETIDAAYREDATIQKPAIPSPSPITSVNFTSHLGDDKYFDAYMDFFKEKIQEKGTASVLEEFIFSEYANIDETAAVHHDKLQPLFPSSFFTSSPAIDTLTEKTSSELALDEVSHAHTEKKGIHALDILARILKDDTIEVPYNDDDAFTKTLEANGEALFRYAGQWTLDLSDPKEVNRKVEELQWMNTVIYAIGGSQPGKKFNSDFFLMHLVTSSLFLPSFVAYLTPPSQALLLRHYMAVSVAWWVSRGRPSFDIPKFFGADTPLAPPTSPATKTPSWKLTSTHNPWFKIVQHAVVHPDDHLCKIQRAFVHYATLYGMRPSGEPEISRTELPGAEKLDGTLFLRAAYLTAKHFEPREGEKHGGENSFKWDGSGFY